MSASPDSEYIAQHRLNVFFEKLNSTLMMYKPENPLTFLTDCFNILKTKAENQPDVDYLVHLQDYLDTIALESSDHSNSATIPSILTTIPAVDGEAAKRKRDENETPVESQDEIESTEEADAFSEPPHKLSSRFQRTQLSVNAAYTNRGRRGSVSAESIKPTEQEYQRVVVPKSDEARMRIASATSSNLLFRNLEPDQKREVVDGMFERKVSEGEVVIQQGDEGDNFYVVDQGLFDVIKNGVKVIQVSAGGSFGELALMYNTPRAASVKAVTSGILWGVDRVTFRRSITNNTFRKRKMYESFLKTVPILHTLETAEVVKIADALEPAEYEDGETIIEQGTVGNYFYIIESGEAHVTQIDEMENEHELPGLKAGNYFGGK
ncbi:cAMP-dependent protein kinase type II-beta regulatory subunit, variant 2 [Basidiobolus ranarum]|uniref:cAMP-dependent protein kinase regulatory subunit n=1 Tax=Basidiobolus ranarum TaxID=34480 RepID=A0ABR2W421_9FUNG